MNNVNEKQKKGKRTKIKTNEKVEATEKVEEKVEAKVESIKENICVQIIEKEIEPIVADTENIQSENIQSKKKQSKSKSTIKSTIKSTTKSTIKSTKNSNSVLSKTNEDAKTALESLLDSSIEETNINIPTMVETFVTTEPTENIVEQEQEQNKLSKKRGRKPKGGKIIQQNLQMNIQKENKPNIILHLKCSMKDLQINNDNYVIEPFHFSNAKNDLSYDVYANDINNVYTFNDFKNGSLQQDESYMLENVNQPTKQIVICDDVDKDKESKEMWNKLKILEHQLHINDVSDKKSCCFWCSYNFDNPAIYIPKHYIKDTYEVYGCFCTPECAVAYLMQEHIDSSTKFERYYLLNHIYSKIYKYNKNIKPAPNPYYMLDKYYGNLTIQEYRALLKSERLFLIVDKPLTRILPEFHEDNDEFIINNKIIPSNNYQVKKRAQKGAQTKNNIMNEKFGMFSS